MDSKNIRNIALIGHSGEGKTTVAEAMLFSGKVIDRMGKIESGNTVMDFDQEEISRRISISLAVSSLVYEGTKINIIDTPGYFDFEGEVTEALAVADAALIIMGASGQISVGAEKAIDHCIKNKIPAMVFINQMDKETSNYVGTVGALNERYGNKIAPIMVPIMESTKMQGYTSLISGKSYIFSPDGRQQVDMPASVKADYDSLKDFLLEVAASAVDELMEKFFAGEELTREEIIKGISAGVLDGSSITILCGSAVQNKGIINLINQIIRLLPDPLSGKGAVVIKDGKKAAFKCKESGNFACQVFKTIADPFVGKLSLFKVIQGNAKPAMTVNNVNQDKQEKAGALYLMNGKKQSVTDSLVCGDIGAFSKLQFTKTGDTLSEGASNIMFAPFEMPPPVISMAITCAKQGEEDKVFGGLSRLMEEDLTFKVEKQPETFETLLSGQGETQIDVLCKKLKNKFNAEAVLNIPKIPFRETIKKTVEAEGKHKKQSGGHGQYGHCKIRFEPCYDKAFEFAEEVVGGSVPKSYIPAVEKGLIEAVQTGVLAGYPMVNIKCVLYDGSYHDVDSNELSFKIAASMAYKEGCAKAGPVLLEPIMEYKITVPDNYLGDIMGDLSRKRGRILGTESVEGKTLITANAPQAEMFKYATDLRSMTQGRGSFVVEFSRYEEVPPVNAQAIIAAAQKKE